MSVEGIVNVQVNLQLEVPIVPSMQAVSEEHAERIACVDAMRELTKLLAGCKYQILSQKVDDIVSGGFENRPGCGAQPISEGIIYYGYRNEEGEVFVYADGHILDPAPSCRLLGFSPSFDWGHSLCGGPSQLALALLLHASANPATAVGHYKEFRVEFVQEMSDSWILTDTVIKTWLAKRGVTC